LKSKAQKQSRVRSRNTCISNAEKLPDSNLIGEHQD
jgi:hypothetical protein